MRHADMSGAYERSGELYLGELKYCVGNTQREPLSSLSFPLFERYILPQFPFHLFVQALV